MKTKITRAHLGGLAAALALLALAGCDDSAVEGAVAPGDDLSPVVISFCRNTLERMDCACFWEKSSHAFNAGNVEAIMSALAERHQYGPMITRGRLEKVAGEEETRRIGRALYDCVDLKVN